LQCELFEKETRFLGSKNCERQLLALSCFSVCLSATMEKTQVPLDGFSWKIIANFSKICRENSSCKWYCVQCCMQNCTQYHLHTAVSRENAFWLVQRNRDTSR